jgi:hypothetical protein
MREERISRPYDEENDRKLFRDDHKSTGDPNTGLPVWGAFEEEEDIQITEDQTVSATEAPTATNQMMMSAATRASRARARELLDNVVVDQRQALDDLEQWFIDKSKMIPNFKIDILL